MDNIIEIKNLKFKYHGTKKDEFHINDISMNFLKGKWTTILGPNGSGKSTLAKLIVRINKSKKGTLLINGNKINSFKNKEFSKQIAYIPQQIEVPHGTTVYDFVSFGRNPYLGISGTLSKNDKLVIKKCMEQTDIYKWKDKIISELSGGERQKVLIAMIIAQDANIILLDEPTTYLDIRNQYELLEMMHHQHLKEKTIITILHDINQAVQYSDFIYILKQGKIYAAGDPGQVITSKSLQEVYGVKAKLYKDGTRKYLTDVKIHYPSDKNKWHKNNHKHVSKSLVKTIKK